MKTFERRMASRGRMASVLAALVSTGLFGLLAVINQAVAKVETIEPPPEPIVVSPAAPDAPVPEKPKMPETPKEAVVLPELPKTVADDVLQPPVTEIHAPTLNHDGVGPFVPGGVWIPDLTFEPGDLDERPEAVRRVAPEYPYREKMGRIDGWARVVFVVDELGQVRDAQIEAASAPAFGRAALTAIRNWRFNPGVKDRTKVRTRMRQPFTFSAGD